MMCGSLGLKGRLPVMVGLVAILLGACTTRGAYEGFREGGRESCRSKAPESDRAACLEHLQDDYDSYARQRQSVLEDERHTEAARKLCYDLPSGSDRADCLKRTH
jgi:hypothetical protein